MVALAISIILMIQTGRLYRTFAQHDLIFEEMAQSKWIRYWMLLLPAAPIVLWFGSHCFGFIPSLILSAVCVVLTWYHAHAQYHFFDAKSVVRAYAAQSWLSQVEMLAILTGIYLILHLLFVVFAHVLTA